MTSPDDQHFCPHFRFQLDAYRGCPECGPESEIADGAYLRLHTPDRRRLDTPPPSDIDPRRKQ